MIQQNATSSQTKRIARPAPLDESSSDELREDVFETTSTRTRLALCTALEVALALVNTD